MPRRFHRFALPLALSVATLALSGCRSRTDLPYLGHWHGRYRVFRLTTRPGDTPSDPQRWTLNADLQLYVDKFLLRMDGVQQSIDIRGTWKIRNGKGITLIPTGVEFDDKGGMDKRDPNEPYLNAEAVQKDLGREIPLRQEGVLPKNPGTSAETPTTVRLSGVESALANVVGRLELEKE